MAQAAQPLDIPSGRYSLDPAHASIVFRVMHMGFSRYTARFTRFDATVTLDAARPEGSTLAVTIDPHSVRTDFPWPEKEDFDAVIASKFLGADSHPDIGFRSTGLVATAADTGELTGDFTLNGVTKPIVLQVKINGAGNHPMRNVPAFGISASGRVTRSAHGLDFLVGPIGDTVEFAIEAEFIAA